MLFFLATDRDGGEGGDKKKSHKVYIWEMIFSWLVSTVTAATACRVRVAEEAAPEDPNTADRPWAMSGRKKKENKKKTEL